MIGKPRFKMQRDVPGVVDDTITIHDDRHLVLTAEGADCLDIGESYLAELNVDLLMRKSIMNTPGKRAGTPLFVADTLIHDHWHGMLYHGRVGEANPLDGNTQAAGAE